LNDSIDTVGQNIDDGEVTLMATPTTGPGQSRKGRPRQRPEQRVERAHQILDAAGELVLRWGYDKTTIDDIARHAGVAKGTIYLHWTTRDALFAALLRRERVAMLTSVRRRVADGEPADGTLHGLLRHLAGELLRRRLMKATLTGDSEVLGRFIRQKRAGGIDARSREAFDTYLDELRRAGAVRTDLTPEECVNVLVAVLYGFLTVPVRLPDELTLADDRLAELLADTCHRALRDEAPERRGPGSAEASEVISQATRAYVGRLAGIAERRFHDSLGVDGPAGDPSGDRAGGRTGEPGGVPTGGSADGSTGRNDDTTEDAR
jgi:AcrR family transcriptional regulator